MAQEGNGGVAARHRLEPKQKLYALQPGAWKGRLSFAVEVYAAWQTAYSFASGLRQSCLKLPRFLYVARGETKDFAGQVGVPGYPENTPESKTPLKAVKN